MRFVVNLVLQECGTWIEISYRERMHGVERQDEVELEVVFLFMTRKLRIPCRMIKPSKSFQYLGTRLQGSLLLTEAFAVERSKLSYFCRDKMA
jgi:hypothetical protein